VSHNISPGHQGHVHKDNRSDKMDVQARVKMG
jgi:hypothetical protein